jgi:twitching motility protein PilI
MANNNKHPIELLHDIEQLSIRIAKGLPQREDIKELWSGIAFRIGEFQFVAPLDQVNEVLHYPALTTFPGTKSWVKGIANIRGSLVPVMDLSAYLGKKHIGINNQSRIMVINRDNITVGLLIDEVQGLKHFDEAEKTTSVTKFDEALKDYVQGAFRQQKDEFLVFNLDALAYHPEFYKVAV